MYVHNLNPTLFAIGPLEIRWYGLVYALGFLFAYWYLGKIAKEGKIKNLTPKLADDYVFLMIVLSIIFSRLAYTLVYNPTYYLADPIKILAIWQGGLSFHGGFFGAILATLYFQRKHKIKFYKMADVLVIPFALVLVFGRIANFINGELPGRITNPASTPWCLVFPDFGEACRHPSQLYEGLKNLIVFGALIFMQTYEPLKRRLFDGALFWTFTLLYGLGRFITDFWREADPTDPMIGGILIGQWLSLAMVIIAIAFLIKKDKKHKKRTQA